MGKELALFIKNDPTTLRIFPELAGEIGLNESILLLQIDFLLKTSDNYRDGMYWTFQSIHDLKKKYFNFWSPSTINRTINSLEKQKLIHVAKFNKRKYDKTRWFTLNEEGLSKLKNINIKIDTHETRSNQNDTGSNQNDTGSNQNDTGSNQNDTTIPETTTEITTETTTDTVAGEISVTENNGKEKSVSAIEPVVNNSGSASHDASVNGSGSIAKFLFNNKTQYTDFRCQKFLELLKTRSNEIPSNYKKLHIGDVNKFKDKVHRVGRKYDKGEIPGALELFEQLPEDNVHRIEMLEYARHEFEKWDFSKTKDKETVLGQFVLEYLLWAPNYAHFKVLKENNLLSDDIVQFNKRNRKRASAPLSKEDEIYGCSFGEYAQSVYAD